MVFVLNRSLQIRHLAMSWKICWKQFHVMVSNLCNNGSSCLPQFSFTLVAAGWSCHKTSKNKRTIPFAAPVYNPGVFLCKFCLSCGVMKQNSPIYTQRPWLRAFGSCTSADPGGAAGLFLDTRTWWPCVIHWYIVVIWESLSCPEFVHSDCLMLRLPDVYNGEEIERTWSHRSVLSTSAGIFFLWTYFNLLSGWPSTATWRIMANGESPHFDMTKL